MTGSGDARPPGAPRILRVVTDVPVTDDARDEPDRTGRVRRLGRWASGHPVLVAVGAVALVTGGVLAGSQLRDLIDPPYRNVASTVPVAPRLTAGAGERIYRIDPARSAAAYEVTERLAGTERSTATGRTAAIAGDLAVNRGRPDASRVGEVVIDVEQLASDSSLRDARIRSDFLESHQYSLARFTTTATEGLPTSPLQDGTPYRFTISGDLSLKATTRPVRWDATASLSGDEVTVAASTTLKMSDFGIGPISIIGLVGTDDEFTLRLELVAVDPTRRDIAVEAPNLATKLAAEGTSPSFGREVRPILERNCVACHRGDAIGADVWRLETAGDAAATASGIGVVTRSTYMPPWPASKAGIALQHDRSLSGGDIDTLDRWARAGGPLDVDSSVRLDPPADDPASRIREDLTVRMAEPYVGDGTQTNDYRCFILDPKFTEPTYVTGYSFVPGTRQVTHHGLVYRVASADRAALDARSGSDGRPGWQCFLGEDFGGAGSGDLVAGWVPGQVPLDFGDDAGFLFQPGDFLVAQLHYHYGPLLTDQSEIRLQTAGPSPSMRELDVHSPTGPVELPCPAAQSSGPLCDRNAALTRLTELYGPAAPFVANGLLAMCGGERALTRDPVTGNGTTTCNQRIRTDGQIVDVLGHMHTIGKAFKMTLNPGTPGEKVLLDIPTWNFEWQLNYQPVEPVDVKRGDVLRIECSWDRGLRFDPEPRYIVFAEGTEDEMCFSTYTVRPNRPSG